MELAFGCEVRYRVIQRGDLFARHVHLMVEPFLLRVANSSLLQGSLRYAQVLGGFPGAFLQLVNGVHRGSLPTTESRWQGLTLPSPPLPPRAVVG